MTTSLGTGADSSRASRVDIPRGVAATALAGTALAAVAGAIQAVRPTDTDPLIDGGEHVLLALFAAALVLWMPGYLTLGRAIGGPARAGSWMAVAGTALLAFAMTATNLNGEDYSWFPALALPANALWAIGSILLAVVAYRRRALPRPLALALPLIWVGSIPLSQLGGSLVAAAIWGAIAWLAWSGPRCPGVSASTTTSMRRDRSR
ncbi:hypothetical protein [Phytohabitans kaempferiae]|uniref:Uncharacterized protein n=1 Tax=Phytohabitans kaempferiae TaxID=1620943 RepID=A0ABV6LYN5_9ACTN